MVITKLSDKQTLKLNNEIEGFNEDKLIALANKTVHNYKTGKVYAYYTMTKEQQFWNWFKKNEAQYFFLNQIDNDNERERLLDEFLEHLHIYCVKLFFEMGGYLNEKQDLIITAEGNIDFFDKVESLVKQAPPLEYWNIIAFKPIVEGGIIKYHDIKLDPETMYFIPLGNKASQKVGLRIYVDKYNSANKKDFLLAAYLVLDNILGEKSNTLNIGYVEIEKMPPVADRGDLIELVKLPRYIEWKKATVNY